MTIRVWILGLKWRMQCTIDFPCIFTFYDVFCLLERLFLEASWCMLAIQLHFEGWVSQAVQDFLRYLSLIINFAMHLPTCLLCLPVSLLELESKCRRLWRSCHALCQAPTAIWIVIIFPSDKHGCINCARIAIILIKGWWWWLWLHN